MQTRRTFLTAAAAGAGAITVMPFRLGAAAHSGADTYATDAGDVMIHPVSHASFVMETPNGVIYNDPVGDAAQYADLPAPDLILITHEHGDHYEPETLGALMGDDTRLLTNPAVFEMLSDDMKARATALANGESGEALGYPIRAIPAYNITEERLKYHPEGRDNGYVIEIPGLTTYIAGDTEGTAEMRALTGIDLAFVPMNLPYTMDVAQAADAVSDFSPGVVYPYHYRDSDPEEFARLLAETDAETEVKMGPWYG